MVAAALSNRLVFALDDVEAILPLQPSNDEMTGGDFLEAGHEEQVDRHPVETEKCTGYGLCAAICHEYCMSLADKKAAIDYEACSTCTSCIAICPQKALSWDGVVPPYRL